jgi:hypothetical protein
VNLCPSVQGSSTFKGIHYRNFPGNNGKRKKCFVIQSMSNAHLHTDVHVCIYVCSLLKKEGMEVSMIFKEEKNSTLLASTT